MRNVDDDIFLGVQINRRRSRKCVVFNCVVFEAGVVHIMIDSAIALW